MSLGTFTLFICITSREMSCISPLNRVIFYYLLSADLINHDKDGQTWFFEGADPMG